MTVRPGEARVRLLFLIADTGGGHRSAARAVSEALELAYPGRFAPVICDPLGGALAPARLRWLTALYGPGIRLTPWLWGALWRWSDSPRHFPPVQRVLFGPAHAAIAAAVTACRPAVIVSFHAMVTRPALRARDALCPPAQVVTVVTDLITAHRSWRCGEVDRIIVPTAEIGEYCRRDGIAAGLFADLGLPVAADFTREPPGRAERLALQRELGASGKRFLIVVTGGAEGSGGIARRSAAILRGLEDVDVVALCGRNSRARRRLARVAAASGGRLIVHGFVGNMADWLRCADVVVTKAGPATIAEATCCGAPLILTSHLPGQEDGNAEFVVAGGAGFYEPAVGGLLARLAQVRRDPDALAAMRTASARLGRPAAAMDIAALLAAMTGHAQPGSGAGGRGGGGRGCDDERDDARAGAG